MDAINEMDYFPTVDGLYNFAVRRSSFTTSPMLLMCDDNVARPMKRLKISMSVSISHSAICQKRDWLLILALQTTFNVHYFFYVVLKIVTNSLPYTAAMMIIIVKNTIKSFDFFFSV
jgi:hypothetical protein